MHGEPWPCAGAQVGRAQRPQPTRRLQFVDVEGRRPVRRRKAWALVGCCQLTSQRQRIGTPDQRSDAEKQRVGQARHCGEAKARLRIEDEGPLRVGLSVCTGIVLRP